MTGAAIAGVGAAVPRRAVTSAELEERLSLEAGWIETRTGIRSRHFAGEGDSALTLAASAAGEALAQAGVQPQDVDYVIVATVTPDLRLPATASLLAHSLGCDAAAFDLNASCSGFLLGLAQADALVTTGAACTVLVAGVDLMSRIVDLSDPKTGILFGDGAGAAVVTASSRRRLGPFHFHSDGSRPDLLAASRDGGKVEMSGREVYRRAVQEMTASLTEIARAAGVSLDDADLVVAHQANGRIVEAVGERLGLPAHKLFSNVASYGNTSAASIPIALADAHAQGLLDQGSLVALTAFGAGFVWGAGMVQWILPRPEERLAEAVTAHA